MATLAQPEHPDLIQAEVRHRFRNIVMIAQSLVDQTLRDGVTIADARSRAIMSVRSERSPETNGR